MVALIVSQPPPLSRGNLLLGPKQGNNCAPIQELKAVVDNGPKLAAYLENFELWDFLQVYIFTLIIHPVRNVVLSALPPIKDVTLSLFPVTTNHNRAFCTQTHLDPRPHRLMRASYGE